MDPSEFVGDSQSEDESFWDEAEATVQRRDKELPKQEHIANTTTKAHAQDLPRNQETQVNEATTQIRSLEPTMSGSSSIADDTKHTRSDQPNHAPTPSSRTSLTAEVTSPNQPNHNTEELRAPSQSSEQGKIKEGDIVEVESRTWPGINKIGGTARVTRVYEEDGDTIVDVRYFLGGSERAVSIEYVQITDVYGKKHRQRRSRNFFHEEFAAEYLPTRRHEEFRDQTPNIPQPKKKRVDKPASSVKNSSDQSKKPIYDVSDSENDETPLYQKYRNLEKLVKPATLPATEIILNEPTSSESDEDDEDNDNYVSVLELHSKPRSMEQTKIPEKNFAAQTLSPTLDVPQDEGDRSPTDQSPIRRRKKRKRFVGGYDGDNNFIQPEDNAIDLPEDVQIDTGFKLGKTSKDLLKQYREHSARFEEALQTFQRRRDMYDPTQLQELEEYLKRHIVREEDIVDAILRKLEAKGKSIVSMLLPY
ncbi:unnamed protein product [Aphanomyces euteiches]